MELKLGAIFIVGLAIGGFILTLGLQTDHVLISTIGGGIMIIVTSIMLPKIHKNNERDNK